MKCCVHTSGIINDNNIDNSKDDDQHRIVSLQALADMSHHRQYDQPGRSGGSNNAMAGWMCHPWTAMPDIDFGSSFSAALRDDGSYGRSSPWATMLADPRFPDSC